MACKLRVEYAGADERADGGGALRRGARGDDDDGEVGRRTSGDVSATFRNPRKVAGLKSAVLPDPRIRFLSR